MIAQLSLDQVANTISDYTLKISSDGACKTAYVYDDDTVIISTRKEYLFSYLWYTYLIKAKLLEGYILKQRDNIYIIVEKLYTTHDDKYYEIKKDSSVNMLTDWSEQNEIEEMLGNWWTHFIEDFEQMIGVDLFWDAQPENIGFNKNGSVIPFDIVEVLYEDAISNFERLYKIFEEWGVSF